MRLPKAYFKKDALALAPDLLGKVLVRRFDDGTMLRAPITELEAYRGQEDLACHASKGRTKRTEVMYHEGGKIYVYLIYGIHWLINIVSGSEGEPQAILIRGLENISGPGRVGKALQVNQSFYGEDVCSSQRIWIEAPYSGEKKRIHTSPRIGIEYAGKTWASKPWRFYICL